MDDTTCPSHGVVRVVGPVFYPPDGQVPGGGIVDPAITRSDNEVVGASILLHGARPGYRFYSDSNYENAAYRGLSVHSAFNGDTPVAPGEIGLLTWDLPTWGVIGGTLSAPGEGEGTTPIFTPDKGRFQFGAVVTVFDDWKLVCVTDERLLKEHTGCLYTLASNASILRSWVGAGVVYSILNQEE